MSRPRNNDVDDSSSSLRSRARAHDPIATFHRALRYSVDQACCPRLAEEVDIAHLNPVDLARARAAPWVRCNHKAYRPEHVALNRYVAKDVLLATNGTRPTVDAADYRGPRVVSIVVVVLNVNDGGVED